MLLIFFSFLLQAVLTQCSPMASNVEGVEVEVDFVGEMEASIAVVVGHPGREVTGVVAEEASVDHQEEEGEVSDSNRYRT